MSVLSRFFVSSFFVFLMGGLIGAGCTTETDTLQSSAGPTSAPEESTTTAAASSPPPADNRIYALLAADDSVLWAGTDHGLFRRAPADSVWQFVTTGAAAARGRAHSMVKHLTEGPRGTLLSAHHSLYRSLDGGATWSSLKENVRHDNGGRSDVLLLAHTDSALFAGFANGGLLRSPNQGGLWSRVLGSEDRGARAFTEAPDGTLYAVLTDTYGSEPTVHRSEDGGTTWARLPDPPVPFRALTAARDGVLFGVGFGAGLEAVRSDDRGETWRPVGALERVVDFTRDAKGRVLGLGMDGMFVRGDDGWSRLSGPDTRVHAAVQVLDGQWYLSTDRGVMRAPTLEGDWSSVNRGLRGD
ncbi:hypothetical protein BSZ35_10505 [Salinibacter sp. 10B]|uniref:WD40/YVTN/BNR-like repeat-containing protein n=1 Tax=Salinibacter sp. 10B TaxID=1923971 RepID=UPI000CF58182|nr:hypothetical protein [Salinibacter sp. 10B]PQJ34972.1 hypothetical protein BSZ35_10505 [Salinibacter sp. 10B]